jgi:hypothetical protein
VGPVIDSLDILFNQSGQSVYLDCPQGRPSAVTTADAWEDTSADTSTPETALGVPTIEAVTLTFSAPSGSHEVDPKLLNLASVTGLVRGRQYLATASTGETEWIEIARIDVALGLAYARAALLNNYATGDALVSARVSASVNNVWCSDRSNLSDPLSPRPRYRAVFGYTVAGVVCRGVTFFDLVRYPFAHTVTATDVDRLSRGWLSRLAEEDRIGQGEAVIRESAHQVKHDLWRRDLSDWAQRNSEVLNELVRRKAVFVVVQAAYRHGAVARELVDYEASNYQAYFEALVGESKTNQQVTADGDAAVITPARILRR